MTGKELQELRKRYGIKQIQLAEFLGYQSKGKANRSMIAKLENGFTDINPRIEMLIKMFFDRVRENKQ